MSKIGLLAVVAVLIAGALVAGGIVKLPPGAAPGGPHGDNAAALDGHRESEAAKGPHGGRMLRDGDLSVEVTIFERGVPPEFRLYCYQGARPIDPAEVRVELELQRLAGARTRFRFTPRQDHLVGDQQVAEPHSFDVTITALHAGRTLKWEYGTYEGRVELGDESLRNSGITVETAAPATLRTRLEVTGQVVANEDRMTHLIPRFPGIVKEGRKRLGDSVAAGEVLAVIQSNESLQLYDLRSALAGTVIRKHVSPGEFVGEGEEVYVVADLSTVWVDLNVYRRDFARVKIGQHVLLDGGEASPRAEGTIAYVSPFGAPNTQTMLARVELPNPTGEWRPGIFVSADIVADEETVPVAIRASALQRLRDWDVVFVRVGDVFEAAPLELGRRDGEWVEVVSGLAAGQRYADRNSFVLKAELGKAGASHDH